MTERFCRYGDAELLELLRSRTNEHRYTHSLAVAKRARELAMKNGADPDRAYFAGLVHDICKCIPKEEQLQTALAGDIIPDETERGISSIWHQYAGAEYIRSELGVTDPEITDAVRWHSTGRAEMTLLDKIVFLADLTGEDRDFPDAAAARERADESLDGGLAYAVSHIREMLLARGFTLSKNEEDCYRRYGEKLD